MVAHRNRDGELKLLTSILRDLREQKATETRLRESEAQLQALNTQLHRKLEDVSASIARELEAPLQAIDQDAARLLEKFGTAVPEAARLLIQEICASAARIRTLVGERITRSP